MTRFLEELTVAQIQDHESEINEFSKSFTVLEVKHNFIRVWIGSFTHAHSGALVFNSNKDMKN